jgi:O-antigen/teichoic acid export membrane protein
MPGTAKKIIRNTIYNSAGFICLVLVNLLLTPYILKKLGSQMFAIWSLIFVITNYLNFFDLGIGSSFSKFIAEYKAKKDEFALNSVINWGIGFYLIYSLLVYILVYLLRGFILIFLKIPPDLRNDSRYALLGMISIFCFSNILRIFKETLNGFQRMDVVNRVTIFSAALFAMSAFLFLKNNQGIKGLVWASGIQSGLVILGSAFFCKKIFPQMKISLSFLKKEIFNRLFKFGIKMQICSWAGIINFQSDKLVLSHFLGLSWVTFYELGQKVAMALRGLPLLAFGALVPAVSELDAEQDYEKLRALYRQGSKYISLATFFLIFLTLLLAPYLIRIWVGDGYGLSSLTLQMLMLGLGLNLLTGMGTSIVRGTGRPEYEARYAVLVLFVQLFLSIILVQKMGYPGVLIGSFSAAFLGSLYFLLIFHKLFAENFLRFAKEIYFKPLAGSLVALVCAYSLNSYMLIHIRYSGIWENLAPLVFNFLIFSLVFFVFVSKTGYIQNKDLKVFKVYFGIGEHKALEIK